MHQTAKKSFIADLWERRLPQFFATYIGICWGLVQFLIFICNRYGFSDNLIDKFLIFALILIPAVLLYTYNHGKPGTDPWSKLEKIFIPSNVVLATIVAVFLAGSSDVQAASTAVEIINEEGEQVTRYVPATSQTRQLAIFPFEIAGVDEEWTKMGFPYLLCRDLEQDMRFFTRSPGSLEYDIKSFDYNIDDKIPFSTKLQIANKAKVDYFVTGENLQQEEEGWSIDLKVYETGSGELFQEKKYTGSDFYKLVDECTIAVSESMFLKENTTDLEQAVDLPASDLVSPNIEALSLFFKARKAQFYEEQYETAVQLFQKATELDPKSAEIKRYVAYSLNGMGDRENAKNAIGEALTLSKQLPERHQLAIKQSYWGMNEQTDNVLVLMNNWIKLYPQDYDPHKDLIGFYRVTYQLSKAKGIADLAVENGHKNRVLEELVDLSIQVEDFDDAEKYLKEYLEAYPDIAKEDMRMGEIFFKKGAFDQAIGFYQNLILDDPQNGKIYAKIADNNLGNGEFVIAEKNYKQALRLSDQAQDSTNVYFKLLNFYATQGASSKFSETFDKYITNLRTYMPETAVAGTAMQLAGLSSMTGSDDHLRLYFDDIGEKLPQMKPVLDCVTNFLFTLFKNDAEEFKKYNQGQCKAMVLQGTPDMVYFINGFQSSMEGNHEESLKNFNIFIEKSGSGGKDFGYLLAKANRLMGKPKEAIKNCEDFLTTSPHNGMFLLQLGLAQLADGDKSAAKETSAKLEKVWANAEPTFLFYEQFKNFTSSVQ